MAERFGSQTHPSGGQRFGSQTYAAVDATAGDMAAIETGADVFAADIEPTIHATMSATETGADVLAATGLSSLSQTMQAHESPAPDTMIATGQVIEASSVRFGDQDHPLGGLRFGIQSWAALGPNGPLIAVESGDDTAAAAGWLTDTGYSFEIYEILASFVDYSSESLASAITGTLDDGYKVLLPVSGAGLVFEWELNAFGNPSLRLSSLTGATMLDDVPWFAWDGTTWTESSFDVSDAMQGAAFMVESGVDTFIGNGSQTVYGSMLLTEAAEDFLQVVGGVAVVGSAAASEAGADTFAATGAPSYVGYASLTEDADDTIAADGVVAIAGAAAATESGDDVFAAAGGLDNSGDMSAAESGADVLAATGVLSSAGAMAATEEATADVLAGAGVVVVAGAAQLLEAGDDVLAADGILSRVGALAAAEAGDDTVEAAGAVAIAGGLAALELVADTFAGAGVVPVEGDAVIGEVSLVDGGTDRFVARGIQGDPRPVRNFDGPVVTESSTIVYKVTSRIQAAAA